MVKKRKWMKRSIWMLVMVFVLMNVVAILHSYRFTHFVEGGEARLGNPKELSAGQKIESLFFGINNPRPENKTTPSGAYEIIKLQGNKEIECWKLDVDSAKGTVILFHGYGGNISSLLDKANVFNALGYHALLVDFMGSGGSEGVQTTIGFYEADQVKTCFDYLISQGEERIYLFGTSMGAVAIMKAINDHAISPLGIILECPFGSMYKTVCARFETMNVPTFPMAGLLVFWGGVQNDFWAFGHQPTEYARRIDCPTLLLHGAKDEKVSKEEIDEIYNNLNGEKHLKIYPEAAHENYLKKYELEWTRDVGLFLGS